MAVIYNLKERSVIPNWRDFKRTSQLGELRSNNAAKTPIVLSIDRALYTFRTLQIS